MFPVRRWPAQDAGHEVEVRRLVAQALVQREAPDTRTGALIVLVHAVGCVDKVVDPRHYGLSRRELRARAKEMIRFGPRVAKKPLDRCWFRNRNGTCRSGGSLPGSASLCSQA